MLIRAIGAQSSKSPRLSADLSVLGGKIYPAAVRCPGHVSCSRGAPFPALEAARGKCECLGPLLRPHRMSLGMTFPLLSRRALLMLAPAAGAAVALAGCDRPVSRPIFGDLRFTDRPPIRLDVAAIDVVHAFKPSF